MNKEEKTKRMQELVDVLKREKHIIRMQKRL